MNFKNTKYKITPQVLVQKSGMQSVHSLKEWRGRGRAGVKRGRLSGVSQLRPMDDTEEKINVTES